MKKNKRVEIRLLPIIINIALILLGALFICLSYLQFENPFLWWASWGNKTSNAIGTTLIASGAVSMLLEMSTLKNLVSDSLKNILSDDFPLNSYSEENLENFHKNIVINLCDKQGHKIEKSKFNKSIYSAFEHKLRESMLDYYYEHHTSHYDITPNEEKGYFSVKASISYKIVNLYEKKADISFRAKTYSINDDNSDAESENAFIINSLEINKKPISNPNQYLTIENIPKMERFDYYNYKIKLQYELGNEKEYNVKFSYQYNMPITDIFLCNKFTHPCKRVEHRFRIYQDKTNKSWVLRVSAFAAYFCNQKDSPAKYRVNQKENDLAEILMEDWIFPGSGYHVLFDKNK